MLFDNFDYTSLPDRRPLTKEDYAELKRQGDIMRAMDTGDGRGAYEKYGYDPYGRQEAKDRKKLIFKPGVHTVLARGSAADVGEKMNRFYKHMANHYDTYDIISVNTVQTECDTCVYITFRCGNRI